MREDEFRLRLRSALGEPPQMAAPVLRPPGAGAPRLHQRVIALVAVTLAILLVVVLVGTRLALLPRGNVLPAATPHTETPPAANSTACHLAVTLIQEADNPGQTSTSVSMGFVNIPSGAFYVDPQARVNDLPGASTTGPDVYSAALRRWLPASPRTVSPDRTFYAYVKLLPAGASWNDATGGELHVVDGATATDKTLWSKSADVEIIDWTSAGILVSTVPFQGGTMLLWRINPGTGAVTSAPNNDDPESYTPSVPSGIGYYSLIGADGSGRSAFYIGSRDKGTKYSVVLVDKGNATTIYSGTVGDPNGFDPSGFFADSHGIWFGNIDGSRVWLWTRQAGLKRFAVSGGPAAPAGYRFTSSTFMPAGPCVPGQFQGVAAAAQPSATTPRPSPTPPPVDWTRLLAKPFRLQDLSAGAACPVSPQVSLHVTTPPGTKGGPNYGYGRGPVYLTGQIDWYSAGSQGLLILIDPAYSGPVLVRTKRLDGRGSVALEGAGDQLAGGAFGIRESSSPPYWGQWYGSMTPTDAGCYGVQFDGINFSADVVIRVDPGPPPPG